MQRDLFGDSAGDNLNRAVKFIEKRNQLFPEETRLHHKAAKALQGLRSSVETKTTFTLEEDEMALLNSLSNLLKDEQERWGLAKRIMAHQEFMLAAYKTKLHQFKKKFRFLRGD